MKVYELQKGSANLDGLRLSERPVPQPGPTQVLIRIRATILLSDGAGEVVAAGPGVSRFQIGDRVAGTFFQVWKDGPRSSFIPALGVPLDGMLAEYVALHEDGVVAIPQSLSFEEAASLPCAGVTAWNA